MGRGEVGIKESDVGYLIFRSISIFFLRRMNFVFNSQSYLKISQEVLGGVVSILFLEVEKQSFEIYYCLGIFKFRVGKVVLKYKFFVFFSQVWVYFKSYLEGQFCLFLGFIEFFVGIYKYIWRWLCMGLYGYLDIK